jgi:hypothetical protein
VPVLPCISVQPNQGSGWNCKRIQNQTSRRNAAFLDFKSHASASFATRAVFNNQTLKRLLSSLPKSKRLRYSRPVSLRGEALAHGLEKGAESPRGRWWLERSFANCSSRAAQDLGAFTSVQRHGGQLKLLNLVVRVVNILRLTRLDHLFPVETDEGAAIQSFSKSAA